MDFSEVFDWCELSSERLIGFHESGLARIGLQMGKWFATHAIGVVLVISIFSFGLLLVQLMLNHRMREQFKERALRFIVGHVLIALIISGGFFWILNHFMAGFSKIEQYQRFEQLVSKYKGDVEAAMREWNATYPNNPINCRLPDQ